MNENHADITTRSRAMAIAFRESLLDASDEELRQALLEEGLDLDHEAQRAQAVIDRALATARPHTGTSRRLRPWIAAAAVVVAGLLLLREGFDDGRSAAPPSPAVLATAQATLEVFRPGETGPLPTSTFLGGDTVVNGPRRARDISLATGDTVTLGRCSMLTLEQDDSGMLIAPQLGRITVHAADGSPLRVRTPLGTVTLRAGGQLEVGRLADGYDLDQSDRFLQLAQEVHMKIALPLIVTSVTLLQGTAHLETLTHTRPLVVGQPLQDESVPPATQAIRDKLLQAVGTWDLTMTQAGPGGVTLQGVEICTAGPGGKWLLTDLTFDRGDRDIHVQTVVGWDPSNKSYTGSLVDNFGGEIGLLKGEQGEDLDSRTLQMYSARSTPGFDVRWRMRWEGPDLRRTRMEMLQDDEWVLASEIIHRRRK